MQPIQALWLSMVLIYFVVSGRAEKFIRILKTPFEKKDKSAPKTGITKETGSGESESDTSTGSGTTGGSGTRRR